MSLVSGEKSNFQFVSHPSTSLQHCIFEIDNVAARATAGRSFCTEIDHDGKDLTRC